MKKNGTRLLLATLLALSGCVNFTPVRQIGEPIPIIVLPDARDKTALKRYVILKLPYGLIIHNGDYPDGAPLYCLFIRNQKRILKTQDVDSLLAELKKFPDGAKIDMISKCTIPFYTQYGVNIDEQYKAIMSLLKRKQFKLVSSLEDDERHASFCYCEGGFTILDEYKSEQSHAPDADSATLHQHR